jgi:hypothetical protein
VPVAVGTSSAVQTTTNASSNRRSAAHARRGTMGTATQAAALAAPPHRFPLMIALLINDPSTLQSVPLALPSSPSENSRSGNYTPHGQR